jgi:hypothetical protein
MYILLRDKALHCWTTLDTSTHCIAAHGPACRAQLALAITVRARYHHTQLAPRSRLACIIGRACLKDHGASIYARHAAWRQHGSRKPLSCQKN